MSSTTTRSAIGGADIEWYDGANATFTRLTSTGGNLTLNKIGNEVDVAEAYGAGTASYDALNTAIGTIGSSQRTLVLKPGTWSITSDITIPANLTIRVSQGAILAVATTKTLTINGPIEAGPYQIFSWAGTGKAVITYPTEILPEWWGAAGDGTTEDTAAFDAAMVCLSSGGTIRLGQRTYIVDTLSNWASGLRILGVNRDQSTLKSKDGSTILDIGGTSYVGSFELGNFRLLGNGGSGHGLSITTSGMAANYTVHDLKVEDCGGKGIYDTTGFSQTYRDIFIDDCGDNSIEGDFGNCCTLQNIYVGIVASGKVGFRIYSSPTMISCNGVNSGEIWGLFGRTVALDGVDSYANPSLINCNIESVSSVGIQCRDGSGFNVWGNTAVTTATSGTVKAVYYEGSPNTTPVWIGFRIALSGSAAWANSQPIHSGGVPALVFYGNNATPTEFYRAADGETYQIAMIRDQYIGNYIRGVGLNAGRLGGDTNYTQFDTDGIITFAGTATIGGIPLSAEGAAPTTGTYKQGAVIFNSSAASGQPAGWMCVTTGTFSAYSTTGTTDGTTGVVTSVGSTAAVSVNDYITIATTGNGPFRVLSKTSDTLTVTPAPDTPGAGLAIATSDPTFKAMANLA